MSFLVDTSVWSLALRRDSPPDCREVSLLNELIAREETIFLIGVILQELLQGFPDERRSHRLERELSAFPLLPLERPDYVLAAEIRNTCRSKGVQLATVDAQIVAAALQHQCALVSADEDFKQVAKHYPLKLA